MLPTRKSAVFPLIVLALLSAAALAVCFLPGNYTPLVWIGLVPFFFALRLVRRPIHGAWLALLFGVGFFGALHRYLLMYGVLPTFLVASPSANWATRNFARWRCCSRRASPARWA